MPRYILKPLRINGPEDTVNVDKAHKGELLIDQNTGDVYYKDHVTGELKRSGSQIVDGTIDGVPIGVTVQAEGHFTDLSASGAFSLTGDTVDISEGGTGASTAAGARAALGVPSAGDAIAMAVALG
jgi:hypothetical protein